MVADAKGFELGGQFLFGTATVSELGSDIEPNEFTATTAGIGLTAVYVTPFYLLLEAGADVQGEEVVFSDASEFSLYAARVATGIEIPVADFWRIAGKIGRLRYWVEPDDPEQPTRIERVHGFATLYEIAVRRLTADGRYAVGFSLRDWPTANGKQQDRGLEAAFCCQLFAASVAISGEAIGSNRRK